VAQLKSTSYKTPCGGSIILTEGVREHLEAHPGILDLIPEIASKVIIPTDGSRLASKISLGRVVGQSSLTNTQKIGLSETAWFAVRKNRMKASRVVPDAGPVDTDLVSIVANPIEKKSYELVTAWFGEFAPKEPWDPDLADDPAAYEESINFWSGHALAYDPEVMDEPFETTWDEIINKGGTIQ
tara:strand:- start:269 stop:820 length:552 start_codon:yes stop_codon:yes gene_type:complete